MKVTVIIPVYNQESLLIQALDSIPRKDDIEVIVIDDGSTDDTWENLMAYKENCLEMNLVCLYNTDNMGVAHAVNKGLDSASGEYVVLLGSDDFFIQPALIEVMDLLDGTDLVYFNLQTNDGNIIRLNEQNKTGYCGSVKFMRRDFIGDTRNDESKRAGEDFFFFHELLKKNPTEKFTDICVKHYNFPRVGSLSDLHRKGEI